MSRFSGQCLLALLLSAFLLAPPARQVCAQDQAASQQRVDLYGEQLPAGALARLGKLAAADDNAAADPPPYHTQTISAVKFSPDGKLVATSGLDMTVRLWNAEIGEQLHCFTDADRPFGFSPDGKYLVHTAIAQGVTEVRAWDLAAKNIAGTTSDAFDEFVFSADEDLLIRTFNGRLAKYRLPDFESVGDQLAIGRVLAFSSDAELAACATAEAIDQIQVRRVDNGDVLQTLSLGARDTARRLRVAISPDKRLLACATSTRVIFVWELATGAELYRFTGHRRDIHDLAFAPDGRYLVSAGLGGEASLWNLSNGKKVASSIEHAEEIKSLAFSPDGSRMATASSDRTVLIWQMSPDLGMAVETEPITAARFETLWSQLASPETNVAFAAQSELGARMEETVPFVQLRIDEILQPSQTERILELIVDLDNDEYMVRERATEELIRFREIAVDELTNALRETRSAEVRHRINRILSTPEDAPRYSRDEINRMIRVVDLLSKDPGESAALLLHTIANGFPERTVMQAAQRAIGTLAPSQSEEDQD